MRLQLSNRPPIEVAGGAGHVATRQQSELPGRKIKVWVRGGERPFWQDEVKINAHCMDWNGVLVTPKRWRRAGLFTVIDVKKDIIRRGEPNPVRQQRAIVCGSMPQRAHAPVGHARDLGVCRGARYECCRAGERYVPGDGRQRASGEHRSIGLPGMITPRGV